MTRQTINLANHAWHFGQVPRRAFTEAQVYDLPLVTEWLPATVPGNVRTDLLALGRIPDPFFGEQYRESLWVEDVDWWYRCRVKLADFEQEPRPQRSQRPLRSTQQRAFVVFSGIDYLSAIFVNGRELARHEGMFSSQTVEITEALQANAGETEIAVRLWGSQALPRRRLNPLQRAWQAVAGRLHGSWVGVYPDRSAVLKSQMSFGWDFAPPIRTMGIWDEVNLLLTGPTFIAEAGVIAQPTTSTPDEQLKSGRAPADVLVDLQLDSPYSLPLEILISLSPANFDPVVSQGHSVTFPVHLPAGTSQVKLHCHLAEAYLWQPWDRGYPHLYQVDITLAEPGGQPVDAVTLRTGIRRVEMECWQFKLNGQSEFMRGLNWVPADCFPGRLRADNYDHLLTLARQSGANLLRVWGGGLREKEAFYDRCDELGLMVWQEFPFACMFLGSFPQDRAYLALVKAEVGAIVRQLRRHPALILWCGGNEFSRRHNGPLLKTLVARVRRYDGSRPFIPTSPSTGASGTDSHNWLVWHGLAPLHTYQAETAQFLSEFGLQALPHPETLAAALPNPTHPITWVTHQADLSKLFHYTAMFSEHLALDESNSYAASQKIYHRVTETQRKVKILETLCLCASVVHSLLVEDSPVKLGTNNEQLEEKELVALIRASQLAQAAGLQTAIEHMRRRKGEAGGICLWQLNEPWPAISWAIIDYFGRPKLAYERLSTWYNPILVSLNFPPGRRWQPDETFTAGLWAINDSLQSYPACYLQVTLDDQLIHTQTIDLLPNSARQFGLLSHKLQTAPQTLTVTLHQGDNLLCRNLYPLDWADLSRPQPSRRFRRWVADWVLR